MTAPEATAALRAVPPAADRHRCGTGLCELRWEGGELTLPNHPDRDAERALAALGGAVPACLEVDEAWRSLAREPSVLVLLPRAGERLAVPSDARRADPRLRVLELAPALTVRLAATVVAACEERWASPVARAELRPRLTALLHGVAQPLLRARFGAEVRVEVALPGEPPLVTPEVARLGLDWLVAAVVGAADGTAALPA